MKKIYLSALGLTFCLSVHATDAPAHPENLLPGLRIVHGSMNGAGYFEDHQGMLGIEPGEKIGDYETLDIVGCDLATGQAGSKFYTIRTEGSKVFIYIDEAEGDSKWALLYDFNPPIGEVFTFMGFPIERGDLYDARCVSVTESNPKYGGLTTLEMDIRGHGAVFPEEFPDGTDRTETWIAGIGSSCGLLDAGWTGWVGGGSWILEAYNGDTLYFTDPQVRRYNHYIESGSSFTQQQDGIEASLTLGRGDDPDFSQKMWPYCYPVYAGRPSAAEGSVILGGIYMNGNKVYYANLPENAEKTKWYTIYDFSLQPGETTQLSRVFYNPFSVAEVLPTIRPVWAECISEVPYEADPKFVAMNMMIYYDEAKTRAVGPVTWIKGIGSLSGLLDNCPKSQWPSAPLAEVVYEDETVFFNPSAGIDPVSVAGESDATSAVYDLSGRRIEPRDGSLPKGLYILRRAEGIRKVMIP